MKRTVLTALAGLLALSGAGCVSGPLADNPLLFPTDPTRTVENPVFVAQGPWQSSYGQVFEKCIDIMADYFPIKVYNRYDGSIETHAKIAPGLEQPWKPGSPDFDQRLMATFQTIRHRAFLKIDPAAGGGFFIHVTVVKELEDLPRPTRATAGAAIFRTESTLERQYEVIDPTVFESGWFFIGRDVKLEQVILQRLKKCL